jgi:hypothetical protein
MRMSNVRRTGVLAGLTICALTSAPSNASADISIGVTRTSLRAHARITVFAGGDPAARRLAIVLVPAADAPRLHNCDAGICPPTSTWPVTPPLRVIGWVSFQRNRSPHLTVMRLPAVRPGHYKLFALWKSPHHPHQRYLLFAASRYRGGGLIDNSTTNGAILTIGPT